MQAAVVDVSYTKKKAIAACVLLKDCKEDKIISEYSSTITGIKDYKPGEFYKRELPPLLSVLKKVKENYELIIIDGYVWLGKDKGGLGYYLYNSLNQKIPVLGVAKNPFANNTEAKILVRGKSKKPLYITSIGSDIELAVKIINEMVGEERIPKMIKYADKLSKGEKINVPDN